MLTAPVPMTFDELLGLPSAPGHTPLIAGVLVVPDHEDGWQHRVALLELGVQFVEHAHGHPGTGSMVLVHDHRGLASHLWWTPGRPSHPDVPTAWPSLAVSVPEHAHLAGRRVPEVWVVDGEVDVVTVHRGDVVEVLGRVTG